MNLAAVQARSDASAKFVAFFVWVIVVLLLSAGVTSTGELFRDTDDYMRAVQVRDLIEGKGWFDMHQPRLDPPAGSDMHWARLPDLPLAGVALVLSPMLDPATALMIAGAIVPPLLLIVLLLTMTWACRPLLLSTREPLAPLITAAAVYVMVQFAPGRVDHHNWQLIFAAVGLGACLRTMLDPVPRRPAVIAGIALGLGSWVGVESIPWIATASAALSLRWVWAGDSSARSGLAFAGSLFATCVVVTPVALPPAAYLAVACDAFSFATLILAATVVLFFGLLALAESRVSRPGARLATCAGVGLACFALLFAALPACRGGPLAAIDPDLARVWLSRVNEAQPLMAIFRNEPGSAAAPRRAADCWPHHRALADRPRSCQPALAVGGDRRAPAGGDRLHVLAGQGRELRQPVRDLSSLLGSQPRLGCRRGALEWLATAGRALRYASAAFLPSLAGPGDRPHPAATPERTVRSAPEVATSPALARSPNVPMARRPPSRRRSISGRRSSSTRALRSWQDPITETPAATWTPTTSSTRRPRSRRVRSSSGGRSTSSCSAAAPTR